MGKHNNSQSISNSPPLPCKPLEEYTGLSFDPSDNNKDRGESQIDFLN